MLLTDEVLQASSYYQKILNKGVVQGRSEGRELLRRLLVRKFGPLSGPAEERLNAAGKQDLERFADQVLDAQSIEEALA